MTSCPIFCLIGNKVAIFDNNLGEYRWLRIPLDQTIYWFIHCWHNQGLILFCVSLLIFQDVFCNSTIRPFILKINPFLSRNGTMAWCHQHAEWCHSIWNCLPKFRLRTKDSKTYVLFPPIQCCLHYKKICTNFTSTSCLIRHPMMNPQTLKLMMWTLSELLYKRPQIQFFCPR